MKLFKRHQHEWRIDREFHARRYIGEIQPATYLTMQCETCAEARERKIASFPMTADQLNNYCFVKYNVAKSYSGEPTVKQNTY